MRLPGRKQLAENDPYAARGQQVNVDSSRHGTIDNGNVAWPERVAEARRSWPQARAEDFEPLDSHGRRFKDRATGTMYKAVPGAPLLAAAAEENPAIACFLV